MNFNKVINHQKNGSAMTKGNGFTQMSHGHKKFKPTTRGWQVLVKLNDGATTWMDLTDEKEASPIELAEYAVANRIDDEPAFA